MMAISNRDVRSLIRLIEGAGGHVTLSKRGHFKVYIGRRLVTTLPQAPSDRRGLLNARAAIRRAGLEI